MQRTTAGKPTQTQSDEGGPYNEQVYLRLRAGTMERIKAAAYKAHPNHQSASEWLRAAIDAALAREDRKRA